MCEFIASHRGRDGKAVFKDLFGPRDVRRRDDTEWEKTHPRAEKDLHLGSEGRGRDVFSWVFLLEGGAAGRDFFKRADGSHDLVVQDVFDDGGDPVRGVTHFS